MGLDIHVRLVIGFKVSYKEKEFWTKRYDEKTGIPYDQLENGIICSHGECPEELEEFTFGYPSEDEEYECVRGESIYYSESDRSVNDSFEMLLPICLEHISLRKASLQSRYPDQRIKVYIFPEISY